MSETRRKSEGEGQREVTMTERGSNKRERHAPRVIKEERGRECVCVTMTERQ